jgi:hypothetical protein
LPLVVAYAALLFLPCLMVGSFVKIDSAKHWNDYDAFWSNYYAREGKSQQ